MSRWLDALEAVPADAVAIIDDDERLSYGELRTQCRRLAGRLHAIHGTGSYLLLRATQSAAFLRALLAVQYSGNVPVPIDPALPAHAVDYVAAKSRAAAVIDPHALVADDDDIELDACTSDLPALVIFTSGTSGFPKGVVISHANLRHACGTIVEYLGYARWNSAAVALPLYYSYALISQALCMLFAGGRLRIVRDLRNPIKFAALVEHEGLQTFCGVPSTYHALATVHRLRPLSMPGVRVLCSAGAALDRTQMSAIREMFPHATFFNNYGMTEAAPRIAFIRDDDPRFDEATCGRPMAGVEVRVVHPETGAVLPDGEVGVLVVKGPNVTAGYLHDPELSAKAFTADGYLISGDLAYLDRGYIFIRGRHDDVFNSGGEKIAPLEIERALNACDGVEQSAVTGVPDDQRGMLPVAFVQCRRPLERRTLIEALSLELPKAKIPARFYEVRSFPMTSNGKLQRRRLSAEFADYVVREIR